MVVVGKGGGGSSSEPRLRRPTLSSVNVRYHQATKNRLFRVNVVEMRGKYSSGVLRVSPRFRATAVCAVSGNTSKDSV